MKIQEIIQPNPTAEQIAQQIGEDCRPYLTAIHNSPLYFPLFRGVGHDLPEFSKQPCPVNRTPRNTPVEVHNLLDQWFLKKTGIRYRSNSVFATGDPYGAEEYGDLYVIFPIGQYQILWSPKIRDLTYDLFEYDDMPETVDDKLAKSITRKLSKAGYSNANIQNGIDAKVEIMIHCPSGYYSVLATDWESSKPNLAKTVSRILDK